MKIIVTGAKGQLGSEIRAISHTFDHDFVFVDIEELDITDEQHVKSFLAAEKADVLVNCAAYTNVDKAEQEIEKAHLVNAKACEYLAKETARNNTFMIHISTDYVFNGENYRPYKEDDKINTMGIYGLSKLNGENLMKQYAEHGLIIRTSWLYSSYGHNFVKTIRKYARQKEEMNVVFDQVGTPTNAADLAQAIMEIIPKVDTIKEVEIYHFSNEGVCSWYDFAQVICEMSKIKCQINPIESHEYPYLTPRPFYSVLNKAAIKKEFGLKIDFWKTSLERCIKKIENEQ